MQLGSSGIHHRHHKIQSLNPIPSVQSRLRDLHTHTHTRTHTHTQTHTHTHKHKHTHTHTHTPDFAQQLAKLRQHTSYHVLNDTTQGTAVRLHHGRG